MTSEGTPPSPQPPLVLPLAGCSGRLERPLGSGSGHAFAGSLLGSQPTEDDLEEGRILHVAFLGLIAHCVSDQARVPLFGRELGVILCYLFLPRALFRLSLSPT